MTRCPICSGTKSRLIIHLHDHFCSGEEFSLYECLSCHVVSTWPIPDADNIQRYYSGKEYISHKTSSRDPLNKLLLLARRITMYLRRRLVEKNIPLPGSLLDIGCGTGAFLSEMMAAGWQVDGIEADAAARQTAEQNLNIAIQPPDKLYTLTKTYDAVTLWHVLEHMQNLPRLVIQFKKMLAPSGELFIAVPNLFSKDAKAYGPFWAAFDVPR
ncbi:class I SAM-dependent methyltransferase, partial [candidate division KSB1 bacterium]|nr:class I SAM-dependent methyltransferase [candidate division KSB1 bacterium]